MEGARMVCGVTEEEKRQRNWALPLICEANRFNGVYGANERLLYFFARGIEASAVWEENIELAVDNSLVSLGDRNSWRNNLCGRINGKECC